VSSTPVAIPEPGPPPRLRIPVAGRTRLDNGLLVRTVQRNRLPIVDALLIMPTGASADSPRLAGLASITAELLDAGTTGRSQTDIARAIDALGARLGSHAHWDFCAISFQVLADRLPQTLAIVAEMLADAKFPPPELERGLAERLAAIEQDLEDPAALAGSAIARAIHGADHVYGTPRYGARDTVERIDRDAIVRCHRARYRPAGATFVVVGDVIEDAVVRVVDGTLGQWAAHGEPAVEVLPVVARQPTSVRLVDRPGAPQSEVRVGTVGAARTSSDYFPLVVLNTILGGSFTSRLNTRLRERGGYTYGAFSAFSFRRHAGPFVAGAAVSADVTARALAETLEEIERMRVEPMSVAELERAKRYVTIGMLRGFEANGSVAGRIADGELHGLGDDWWDRYADRIGGVDAEAVRDAAERYLDPAMLSAVVVGDAGRTRDSLESLGIGPVVDTVVGRPPRGASRGNGLMGERDRDSI
jgi:predicted Zn-dependent peptidase